MYSPSRYLPRTPAPPLPPSADEAHKICGDKTNTWEAVCALMVDGPCFGLSGTLIQNSFKDILPGLEWAMRQKDAPRSWEEAWKEDVYCDNLQSICRAKGIGIRLTPRTVVLPIAQPAERLLADALA